MKKKTIFITYNPEDSDEQTLAIRLHTIGAANGFRMYLPDRFNSDRVLDISTKNRINESDYFILFAFQPNLSQTVMDEIDYAWQHIKDKSKIIVIYRSDAPKKPKAVSSSHSTEIYFNPGKDSMESVIHHIMNTISKKEERDKMDKQFENGLLALLGIGLGLLILNELTKE